MVLWTNYFESVVRGHFMALRITFLHVSQSFVCTSIARPYSHFITLWIDFRLNLETIIEWQRRNKQIHFRKERRCIISAFKFLIDGPVNLLWWTSIWLLLENEWKWLQFRVIINEWFQYFSGNLDDIQCDMTCTWPIQSMN